MGFLSNIMTAIPTFASVFLNVLFYGNYYKVRYYFNSLGKAYPNTKVLHIE